MSRLLDAAGEAPFIFVTGKGGVGKTTTAAALALELADAGVPSHLISTDPAHSLGDVLRQEVGPAVVTSNCSTLLRIEEFDAARARDAWVEQALEPVGGIVEGGTYLDHADVAAFSRLALPGIDEMMAVLRLAELAAGARTDQPVIVDTAPTGHTLRLLDAADTHEAIARALRAMADKAAAVAGAMTGRSIRMSGEDVIDRLEQTVGTYRGRVLAPAAFIIVTRAGSVVEAETRRLGEELRRRGLRTTAVVCIGPCSGADVLPAAAHLSVPLLDEAAGCEGLRTWREHVGVWVTTAGPGPQTPAAAPSPGRRASAWVATAAGRLLLFAGKGGVGKSTCAAAAALALAESRDVLLCSTDPAGSLSDVLGTTAHRPAGRLRVMQIEPAAHQERLRASYGEEITAALERLGLSESAALDRRVIETLWDLSPPGLDELAATAAMLRASRSGETVVIDSSPTGHFLRLLEMPDIALGWTRQLMRVIVKYGMAGVAGGAGELLLELSRDLRALRDTLHDPGATAVIIVTLLEPAVQAETQRLAAALANADVRVAGVLLNRAAGRDSAGVCAIRKWSRDAAILRAPDVDPPPVGLPALRGFLDAWNIVG